MPNSTGRKLGPIQFCASFYGLILLAIILFHYPYHTDPVSQRSVPANAEVFYRQAYAPPSPGSTGDEDAYVRVAKAAASTFGVEEKVRDFVSRYKLANKKVLEVGAGRGYLQNVVEDYTGLDISPSAARYFQKPFVQASATAMPFPDSQFDAVWSIWVLEHVPSPENALAEIRRVTKNNGLLFLAPAWDCKPWAAQGYQVRPYGDLDWRGKFQKATLVVRSSEGFAATYRYPIRLLRLMAFQMGGGPTRLHYVQLEPNYERYWQPDSDAVNSIDSFEAYLWFISRGDECLNCGSTLQEVRGGLRWPLIIRVRKNSRT